MKIIAVTLGLLLLFSGCPMAVQPLPYEALEDMKESDVVDRGYVVCPELPVPAFALHPEGKGWWMLWVTAQGWIMSYFGAAAEEPADRARPILIYYGRWNLEAPDTTDVGERHRFQLDHTTTDPGPEHASALFCTWLLPTEKPSA